MWGGGDATKRKAYSKRPTEGKEPFGGREGGNACGGEGLRDQICEVVAGKKVLLGQVGRGHALWAWVHLAETEGGQGPGGPLRARSEEKPTKPTALAVCFWPIQPQRETGTGPWAHRTSPSPAATPTRAQRCLTDHEEAMTMLTAKTHA